MTDGLKAFADLFSADSRMANFHHRLPSGEFRPVGLADQYAAVAAETITSAASDDVHEHFDTLRHLCVYSWCVYRFISVAQLYSFVCMEFALRSVLVPDANRSPGFGRLIDDAATQRRLCDADFRDRLLSWRPVHGRSRKSRGPWIVGAQWLQHSFVDYVAYFRNEFAHGSSTLMPDGGLSLRLTADLINALYRSTP